MFSNLLVCHRNVSSLLISCKCALLTQCTFGTLLSHLFHQKSLNFAFVCFMTSFVLCHCFHLFGARGSAVGWGTMLHGVIGIFSIALRTTQLLARMSTRNISWGEGGWWWWWRLTTLLLLCTDCHEIWKPRPPATLGACLALYWDCFCLHWIDLLSTPFSIFSWYFHCWIHISCLLRVFRNLSSLNIVLKYSSGLTIYAVSCPFNL